MHYEFGELIFGGAYFQNFTVCFVLRIKFFSEDPEI